MTKFMTTASPKLPPETFPIVISKLPAPTADTLIKYEPDVPPDAMATIGTSVEATALFVTVNFASAPG